MTRRPATVPLEPRPTTLRPQPFAGPPVLLPFERPSEVLGSFTCATDQLRRFIEAGNLLRIEVREDDDGIFLETFSAREDPPVSLRLFG
jgi:hypothetical protein